MLAAGLTLPTRIKSFGRPNIVMAKNICNVAQLILSWYSKLLSLLSSYLVINFISAC
jgi:hypothetical protein